MLRSSLGFVCFLTLASTTPTVEVRMMNWEQWLIQGGSFALLTFIVLRIMLKTLPAMESTIKSQAQSHARAMSEVAAAFTEEVKALHGKVEERDKHLIELVKNCQECQRRLQR